eukprot:3958442-Pyramimonas_sp.AAC.1
MLTTVWLWAQIPRRRRARCSWSTRHRQREATPLIARPVYAIMMPISWAGRPEETNAMSGPRDQSCGTSARA